jgi:hypothetical protein
MNQETVDGMIANICCKLILRMVGVRVACDRGKYGLVDSALLIEDGLPLHQ